LPLIFAGAFLGKSTGLLLKSFLEDCMLGWRGTLSGNLKGRPLKDWPNEKNIMRDEIFLK
jgi:hypothetical protein